MGVSATHRIRRIGTLIFVIAVISYGLFQARDLIIGPIIVVESPEHGATVETALIEIRGQAQNISEITLNSHRIFVDEEGHFVEALVLAEGYTIMTLEARDRFGRHTEELLEIVYQNPHGS